jgi:hypothetical protein
MAPFLREQHIDFRTTFTDSNNSQLNTQYLLCNMVHQEIYPKSKVRR